MSAKAKAAARPDLSGEVRAFYSMQGPMTEPGKHAKALGELPNDIPSILRVVQGLAIHQFVAEPMYGVKISEKRLGESHLRQAEKLIDRILALDPSPLTKARPPERRLVGVCHHFARLTLAILRTKSIPARARCGFGAYFNPGFYEDHVLVEYWQPDDRRWVQIDPQFDEPWRKGSGIKHDYLDVPHDQFLIAADAWEKCRAGKADPEKFGIFQGNLRGLWFIAGSLVRDLAWLNKQEMLQWDAWGAIPPPGAKLTRDQLEVFDQLAAMTRAPDARFGELRRLYETADDLRVPPTVFNAVLQRPEAIGS
jgi:hypothetical protein